MTVNELYRSFLDELESIYPSPEATDISSMVFESIIGISRSGIIKDPSRILDDKTIVRLHECLLQLKDHKPVQYVTGEAWFYKMKLKVSPAVLIPRPETEELVDEVIRHLKNDHAATVLDIGTGSGCIAIAIKKNTPDSAVTGIDISNDALNIARENAVLQQTDINFQQLDFLDEFEKEQLASYDVIVSNPPYIPESEKQMLDKNVAAFEPHLALFVENKYPLIFYEKIAAFGKTHLNENGKIFMETHEHFAEQTAALFNEQGYSATIKKDMNGNQRMVMATHRSL